jgi:hypothetical protein
MSRSILFTLFLLLSMTAQAAGLGDLSSKDATGGLREALVQGAAQAVALLGKTDGFLGNPQVRIALPDGLNKAAGLMRNVGMGKQVDELETTMNRAAEAAVPEAKALLTNAIRQMSVDDAKAILAGGDDAATQFFRRTTSNDLGAKFKPIVKKAIARVKLADTYERFAGKASRFGLVKEADANLEDYVTGKALDGLFAMIAEEEKRIRKNPAAAAGSLAKKVFGMLR